jgi:hypothetical protein
MLRRRAGGLLAAALVAVSACSTTQVSRSAELFFTLEQRGAILDEKQAVDEQKLTERGTEVLADAQRAGTIPDTVALRHLPDTVVLEVIVHAESAQGAARTVNHAVDELAVRLNRTDHGLGLGQFVVVRYAVD